tara:strand:+ start:100545 stop:101534 length:990 start_codon:yes stop_codon:yes gene_type:complete
MTSSRRKEQFLPYAYRKGGLEIADVQVENDLGDRVGLIDRDRHLVDLSNAASKIYRVRGNLRLSQKTVSTVFFPSELTDPPGHLVLVVRAPATHERFLVEVSSPPCVADSYPFALTLERSRFAGTLEVTPYLLRSESSAQVDSGFASLRGMRLASSRSWELRLDAVSSVAGAFLDVRYQSFKEQAERFAHPDVVFELDCGTEAPILWLNSDHARVCEILDSRATHGVSARMRDLMFDNISSSVWTQLFLSAVWDIREADESTYRWQQAVLQRFLPKMYSQSGTLEDQRRFLRLDLEDGGMAILMERFAPALQGDLEIAKHCVAAAQEVG